MLKWLLVGINLCLLVALFFVNGSAMSPIEMAWKVVFCCIVLFAVLSFIKSPAAEDDVAANPDVESRQPGKDGIEA